jgi:uncharacterized protein YdaU (DUF1376 family)
MARGKTDIWMPVFLGDHLAETTHLTTTQHGAYFLLLMATWMAGGSLLDDDTRLAAIARMTPQEWAAHRDTLAEFFTVADGRWHHEAVARERAHAEDNKQKKSTAGSKGAAKRWQTDGPSPSPSSEAEASGADQDIAAVVFGQGLAWLLRASGKSEGNCRSLLGKWRKSLGTDEALLAVLGRAQREGVIEPIGWIEKAIAAHRTHHDPPKAKGFNG